MHINARFALAKQNRAMTRFPEAFDEFAGRMLSPNLSDGAFLRIRALSRLMHVPRGDIAEMEETADALVFIVRGATKLVAHTATDRDQIVGFYFGGDLLTVPGNGSHAYNLYALADSELIVQPYEALLEVSCGEPFLLSRLLANSQTLLGRCRDKAVILGRKTAPERIAGFLVYLAQRIGKQEDGAILLNLPMSRRDIGDSIGLTIETVCRQLGQLREEGLIRISGRSQISLLDLRALRERAGFLPAAA